MNLKVLGSEFQDRVNQVPLFGPGVHPSGFELICLAEDGVGDTQLEFSTLAQEE